MRYVPLCVLLGASLVLFQCSSPAPETTPGRTVLPQTRPPVASADQIFADYLRSTFGHSIPPKGAHWYVVIPAVGCVGCAHSELRQLSGTRWATTVTVVTSGLLRDLSATERLRLSQNVHLLADTAERSGNKLDRLNLPFSTLTGLVRTENGKAVAFTPFDVDSYKKVFATLPK